MEEEVRLQKYLADCGIASRRRCEKYILQGKVRVNESIIKELGAKIKPCIDTVLFEGKEIRPKKKIWIMLNKPPKVICSSNDPRKKSSFLHLLPNDLGRVFAVGRLDYMSEGLLLITNDGKLANNIIHPRYEIQKKYEVKTCENISFQQQNQMINGIWDKNELLKIIAIKKKENVSSGSCYEITLGEGKNRHIRRMLASLNIHIVYLKRTQIGPLRLGSLKLGCWCYLKKQEIEKLANAVKKDIHLP
jgi:23S rRNA pseudouridine2605 synthase